ncbi:hypothetical protein QR680_017847 [Steinernema hermaphroditum]|uniref:Uncharacterized protein n=1 Tax=Steinernema hermaphroditum TaxID=289476 RepID=A0AA39HGR0_9BILA|nr:hypothetical protein QR680_017847 [Steinernema hermaphroditum]
MPMVASLEELKAEFLGDHELQSVFIEENLDDRVATLCERTINCLDKSSKKATPHGKSKKEEREAQKRRADLVNEKKSKKQKLESGKASERTTEECAAPSNKSDVLPKKKHKNEAIPITGSPLNLKPEEGVEKKGKKSFPPPKEKESTVASQDGPSTSAAMSQEPSTSTTNGAIKNSPVPPDAKATIMMKRIPKIPKANNVNLSQETDALLDLAGHSLATSSKRIPLKQKSSMCSSGKVDKKSPQIKTRSSPRKPKHSNSKSKNDLQNDDKALANKYSMERRETTNHQSPLQMPSYVKEKTKHMKDTFGTQSNVRRKDKRESPEPSEPWNGEVWLEDFEVSNSETKEAKVGKQKKDLCQCFRRNDHDKTCFQPFNCTHDLEDVGMTILKFNMESLQIDLKFCEDAFYDKNFFGRRVSSLLSIDDYLPMKTVFQKIAQADKAVEFLLVFFWDCPDNDVNTIRRLYHSLKCSDLVAVLAGLDEDPTFSTYLLPYTNHESLPPSMTTRKLNFIGSEAGQPAFIFVIAKNPEPDTQSSAVSSTAVVPGELSDLPDGVFDSEGFEWKSGLLSVDDLVDMCRRTQRIDRVREYVDWFVESFFSTNLDFDQRNVILLSLSERSLLSTDSKRWLQLWDAPPIEYEVDPDLEAVFHKSLRPYYGFSALS